jgi:KDO2-lipid IV(A) lauroyltransferase
LTGRQVSFFISLFYFFSSAVPRRLHRFFAALGNHLVFFVLKKFREDVEKNMRVIGKGRYSEKEVSRLAKQCFQNYSLKLLDYMAMHRLDSSNKKKWVENEIGEENLVKALAKGKGVLCITPHLGNWELGGYVLASKGYPINILTLQEESQYLSRYEEKLRKKARIHTIAIDPKERPSLAILEIIKRLRENEIIAMVSDRFYEGQGVEIDFFGQSTLFPKGAVQLALETGAIIIPVFVVLKPKMKYWGIIGEPIPIRTDVDKNETVRQGVQEIAKRFEEMISRYPDQWFNFFYYWKDDVKSTPSPSTPACAKPLRRRQGRGVG